MKRTRSAPLARETTKKQATIDQPSPRPSLKRRRTQDDINATLIETPGAELSQSASQVPPRKRRHIEVEYEESAQQGPFGSRLPTSATPNLLRDSHIVVQAPKNWKSVYERIEQMRERYPAPVDTMGCGSWFDRNPHLPESVRTHCRCVCI